MGQPSSGKLIMFIFISTAIGRAGSYTLSEQPKPPGFFQRTFAAVKPKAKLPPQPGFEDHFSHTRFKSITHWDKFKAKFVRLGKPSLNQLMQKNATPRTMMSHASVVGEFALKKHDAALKAMGEKLGRNNPGMADITVAAWRHYEGVIENEMQPAALQNKFSLEKRLALFVQNPEQIQPKRNLAAVVISLATVQPADPVTGLPKELEPGNAMLDAAREASLVTPRMSKIGAAAAEASKWFKFNGNESLAAGSPAFLHAQSLCESLLAAIGDIRSGRDMGQGLVAAQATESATDYDGDIGESIYFTIPGPQSVPPVGVSAAKVFAETAADQGAGKKEPIYAQIMRNPLKKLMTQPLVIESGKDTDQICGTDNPPPVPPKSWIKDAVADATTQFMARKNSTPPAAAVRISKVGQRVQNPQQEVRTASPGASVYTKQTSPMAMLRTRFFDQLPSIEASPKKPVIPAKPKNIRFAPGSR